MRDRLVTVLGSSTRAYSLAILAGTRIPLTGYRISKLAGLSPPNVYAELGRLEAAGVVRRQRGGWTLVDDKVRSLCEGAGPLFRRTFTLNLRRRPRRDDRRPLGGGPEALSRTVKQEAVSRLLLEFSRSPSKNTLLRAAGLKPSRHLHR